MSLEDCFLSLLRRIGFQNDDPGQRSNYSELHLSSQGRYVHVHMLIKVKAKIGLLIGGNQLGKMLQIFDLTAIWYR